MIYKCRDSLCRVMLKSSGYCPTHSREEKKVANKLYDTEKRDKESHRFYNSKAWKVCRQLQIERSPICEHCKIKAAQLVHHRKPLKSLEGLERYEASNLQSLCWSCHSRLEWLRKMSGDDTAELETYTPIDWDSIKRGKNESEKD